MPGSSISELERAVLAALEGHSGRPCPSCHRGMVYLIGSDKQQVCERCHGFERLEPEVRFAYNLYSPIFSYHQQAHSIINWGGVA